MGIALVGSTAEANKVISALKTNGFNAYIVAITHQGAKSGV
jgi:cell division septation protein DedD